MNGTTAAWVLVAAVATASFGCGSSVTVQPSGSGGSGANSSTAGGGSGGVAGSPSGGTGGVGATGTGGTGGVGGTGTGGAVGGGGSGGAAQCPDYGDACTICASANCSEVYCSCYDEPHCFGYLQCLGTCQMGDAACAQNCAAVHEQGISAAILVADCAATTCDGDCMFGNPLTGCQKCSYTLCSGQMNDCIADADCIGVIQCFQGCPMGDMACYQQCAQDHPDGFAKFQVVRDCQKDECPDQCQ